MHPSTKPAYVRTYIHIHDICAYTEQARERERAGRVGVIIDEGRTNMPQKKRNIFVVLYSYHNIYVPIVNVVVTTVITLC